ncbi:helix-turn-helix domain-containing protein [Actinocorallia longicatena]|uniref:Helix-turn-helix domain-containing protein n=1 Tax=Actinocorallia longicatena TaxID=111803 RepID=A0ABP6Q3A7_9ACTN
MTETLIGSRAPLAADALRAAVPGIIAAAVDDATAADGAPLRGLRHALRQAMDLFLDPAMLSERHVEDVFQRMGARCAGQGVPLAEVRTAQQAATGTAFDLLTRHLTRSGALADPQANGLLMRRALDLIAGLKEATTAGYLATVDDEPPSHVRPLLDLLLQPDPDGVQLALAADRARWRLPRGLAVIALKESPAASALHWPADVLLHPAGRFLVVPDPEGPGRPASLRRMLEGRPSAIGPTVGTGRAEVSLRLARRTLDLLAPGSPGEHFPVRAIDHVPDLMIMSDPDLFRRLTERTLAPLAGQPRGKRAVFMQTLLAYFECGYSTGAVADRLHVHAQTVRYRIRRLEEIFGPELHDPDRMLDHLIALRAWRLLSAPDGAGVWQC